MTEDIVSRDRLNGEERRRIEQAVERGIALYIDSRRAKIPEFVDRHFSFKGALALHRKTFGKDFYRHPLNMLWGLPALLSQTGGMLLEKLGAERLSRALGKIPTGLKTEFQKEINWLIQTELLELPSSEGDRVSTKDALLEAILGDPELSAQCAGYLEAIERKSGTPAFRHALEAHLSEYGKSKLAASELAGNIINLAAGYALFQKATPGAISVGSAVATAIAQQVAIAHFWLGPVLGTWYYAVFPASASLGLIAASTAALMAATGLLAALSLVIADPLLAKTGFHKRRLERFVAALDDELNGRSEVPYRVRDQYLARVLDLVDLLKLAARAAERVM
ncbi:MAG TPA: DUF6635 family protein [Methylococcaceae bacterium]|nr:DUF6635 family protein [Methylococcaceae bacterium]